jgi:hypothetical protein
MTDTKTLHQREKELTLLMASLPGRAELHALAARYHATSGRLKPARTSVITYILVHEREQGLING